MGQPSDDELERLARDAADNPMLQKIPVPPEVIVQALRDFDEQATLEEIRKMRESGGFTLEDIFADLEQEAGIVPDEVVRDSRESSQ